MISGPGHGPSPTRSPVRWGLGDVVAIFVAATFAAVLVSSVAVAVRGLAQDQVSTDVAVFVASALAQYGTYLGGLWFVSAQKGLGDLDRDFGLRVDLRRDWWVLGLGVALVLLVGALSVPLSLLDHHRQAVVDLIDRAHGLGLALVALVAGLVAPVVEELLFRGLLLRSLLRRVPATPAVALCGLLFGLVHVVFDPGALVGFPGLVLVGILSGYFAVRTGRLSRSILLHVGFNLVAIWAAVANSLGH